MSVAAALAEAHHHSAPKVGAERYNAPRSQKTASAGTRPGVLKDPEPQGWAVTVGYLAAPVPLLKVSSMAGDVRIDDTALLFLVRKVLEEKERRQEEEEEEEEQAARTSASSAPKRTRKKEEEEDS